MSNRAKRRRRREAQERQDKHVEKVAKDIYEQGAMGGRYDPHADPEGEVFRPDAFSAKQHASTTILVKDIGQLLDKHYRGWAWVVQPDERNEMINILNWHLHDEWGIRLRMIEVMNDTSRKQVIRQASVLLRRFNMPSGPFTSTAKDTLAEAPRDARGRVVPNLDRTCATENQIRTAQLAVDLHEGRVKVYTDELGNQTMRVDHK